MCKPNACCQSSKLPRLGFYGLDFPVSPMTFIEIGHFGSFLERIGKSTRSWGLATEVIPDTFLISAIGQVLCSTL